MQEAGVGDAECCTRVGCERAQREGWLRCADALPSANQSRGTQYVPHVGLPTLNATIGESPNPYIES